MSERKFRRNWHYGFFRHGQCWKWEFRIARYNTCTFYHFWRFYLSIDT